LFTRIKKFLLASRRFQPDTGNSDGYI